MYSIEWGARPFGMRPEHRGRFPLQGNVPYGYEAELYCLKRHEGYIIILRVGADLHYFVSHAF